jgi:hypothetical protein
MQYVAYSHCGGAEALPATLQKEITSAITAITAQPARGAGKRLRLAFLDNLKSSGWSSEVSVAEGSHMTITSIKNQVGLCLQTGNMGRMYADLMKLQTLYLNKAIKGAAIILPSNRIAKVLGSNIAEARRLQRELNIFKKAYDVPTMVFGLE